MPVLADTVRKQVPGWMFSKEYVKGHYLGREFLMKKLLLILVLATYTVFFIKAATAEDRAISGNGHFPIVGASKDAGSKAGKSGVDPYIPEMTYPGVFEKYRLYYRRSPAFWKGTKRPAKIFSVKCQSALNSLSTTGTWTGNLNSDGSCTPPVEPAEWATGNYLNYQSTPDSGK